MGEQDDDGPDEWWLCDPERHGDKGGTFSNLISEPHQLNELDFERGAREQLATIPDWHPLKDSAREMFKRSRQALFGKTKRREP